MVITWTSRLCPPGYFGQIKKNNNTNCIGAEIVYVLKHISDGLVMFFLHSGFFFITIEIL